MNLRSSLVGAASALAMVAALAAPAAADAIYVVFANPANGALAVKGAAADAEMAKLGALQVDSLDAGIDNPLVIDPAADAIGPGRASFKPLSMSLPLGPGVPALLQTSGAGGHYGGVTVHFRTGGDKPVEYATLALEIVAVSAVDISASGGNPPQATVTLSYGAMKLDVLPAGGSAKEESGAWNVMSGTADPTTVPKPQ